MTPEQAIRLHTDNMLCGSVGGDHHLLHKMTTFIAYFYLGICDGDVTKIHPNVENELRLRHWFGQEKASKLMSFTYRLAIDIVGSNKENRLERKKAFAKTIREILRTQQKIGLFDPKDLVKAIDEDMAVLLPQIDQGKFKKSAQALIFAGILKGFMEVMQRWAYIMAVETETLKELEGVQPDEV